MFRNMGHIVAFSTMKKINLLICSCCIMYYVDYCSNYFRYLSKSDITELRLKTWRNYEEETQVKGIISICSKGDEGRYTRTYGKQPVPSWRRAGTGCQSVNRTRLDETFPVGPYSGRWESSHKYSSKYSRTASLPSWWEVWLFILSSENKDEIGCRHFPFFAIWRHTLLQCLLKTEVVVYSICTNRYALLSSTFPPNF